MWLLAASIVAATRQRISLAAACGPPRKLNICFVDLTPAHPIVYVVPAVKVAAVAAESHAVWLETPGRRGQSHNDSDLRRVQRSYGLPLEHAPDGWLDTYLEKWDLIIHGS